MKSNVNPRFLLRTLVITGMLVIALGATNVFASGSTGGDAYLGVYTQYSNKMLQDDNGYGVRGLYVQKVERRSPADDAGIEAGDIILKVGKREITSRKSLQRALWKMEPGDIVNITVWRDGKKVEFEATLSSKAEKYELAGSKGWKEYKRAKADYFREVRNPRLTEITRSIRVPDRLDVPFMVPRIEQPDFPDALDRARATRKAKQALYELSSRPIEVPELEKLQAVRELADDDFVFPVPCEGINDRMALD